MAIKVEEISALIRGQIESYQDVLSVEEIGTVAYVSDGITHAYGLENAMSDELLEFSNNSYGTAQNLKSSDVGIIILDDFESTREGDRVKRTGKIMEVPVGEVSIGRVANSLSRPIDGLGGIVTDETRPVEAMVPGVMQHKFVNEPTQTGLKAIGALVPIGHGQRELVVGDHKTGKTSIVIDAIVNQKD